MANINRPRQECLKDRADDADLLESSRTSAEWRAAKLQWIVKDAEAKIAAEKMRIAAAKMQMNPAKSCKADAEENE